MYSLLLAVALIGQTQAPAPDQAPPVVIDQAPPVINNHANWTKAQKNADSVIVVFIGVKSRPIKLINQPTAIVVCEEKDFVGYSEAIIVAIPDKANKGQHRYYDVLSPQATDSMIKEEIAKRIPFSNQEQEQVALVDTDPESPVWTKDNPRPSNLVRYTSARNTQRIFNQRERWEPVDRSAIEAKWNVPGGLLGVSKHRWKSYLYKLVPQLNEHLGDILVENGLGYGGQMERGWKRSYPDGTEFHDVLVNTDTGKVFEHRVAEKTEGRWERYTAFKDKTQQPIDYVRPTSKSCLACHSEAGSGAYGVGLVPGGDTVISDPFSALR